ncbi:MAG: hypothetical protein RLO06_10530 [Parvibaculum sp.]
MTDVTYTVFNSECDDPEGDEHKSGLTLEDAGAYLLDRAGCTYEFRREEDVTTLWRRQGAPPAQAEATLWHTPHAAARGVSTPELGADAVEQAVHEEPWEPTELVSHAAHDATARMEIWERVVAGDLALRGAYMALADNEYLKGLGASDDSPSDDEAEVVNTMRFDSWRQLDDPTKRQIADRLVEAGVLEKQAPDVYRFAVRLY